MTDLDVAAVRAAFPALRRTQDGVPVAFLDGPGGSQVPEVVIEAIASHLRDGTANAFGVFSTSRETAALLRRAREVAARLTGSHADEIAFGASMTTLSFQLAHAIARTLEPGDEVVVTALDHDANVAPWLQVAADHGLVVRTAPVRPDATLDEDAFEALLTPRTRVVALTAASNASGAIPDVRRLADAARAAGALVVVDAVHLAPHRRPDRRALGADVLLLSPYKLFGPHLGVAAIERELAVRLPADRVRPAAQEPPGHRFETGTPSFEALAGFVAAVGHLETTLGGGDLDAAYAAIAAHEDALAAHVLDGLRRLDGVVLHGPDRVADRTPTFCLTVAGREPLGVAQHLADRGVFVWSGGFYALGLMRALGLEEQGTVRAGFLHYNTVEEADRLLDGLAALG